MTNQVKSNQKAWLGIVLVVIGGYFLLRNLDLIPYFLPYYLFGWEMILVVIGGAMLVTGRKEGLIFVGIGALFLIPDIVGIRHFHFRDWWPLILIAAGVSVFLRQRSRGHLNDAGAVDDDFVDDTSIFGGSEKSVTSQNFQGGKITAVFGGSEINFENSRLSPSQAVLDIFCMFGGNTLFVPTDWTVINESFVIFGGYTDSRFKKSSEMPDPDKVLRIKGFVMFGGVEVKAA